MNILYLHSHDTGRCIQPYGEPVPTPALQSFAEGGSVFLNAHSAAPTCSPSRAALLTGQSAHKTGMVGLAHRGGELKFPERHLANFLKSRGFRTLKSGVSHVGTDDEAHGYMQILNDNHDGEQISQAACDFLEQASPDQPFFLDAGFIETHRAGLGFSIDRHSPGDGDGDPAPCAPPAFLGEHRDVKRDWRDLYNSVERLDGYYGRILRKLEETGLDGDTLVIATTDHGVAFPEMKCSLTGRGTGVLLIMRLPERLGSGRQVPALVSHLDVYPTICDLLDLPAPDWLEGHSLLPLLKDDVKEIREELFAEVTFHAAFEPKRAVRTREWLYIRNFAAPHSPVMPNCDHGLTKRYWMNSGKFDREVLPEELYDLQADPGELHNLAGDPVYDEVKAGLREKLGAWMERTQDPLLNSDPTAIPDPMIVNTWDQAHPSAGNLATEWKREQWSVIQPL